MGTSCHCFVHMHYSFMCSVVILFKRANVGRVIMIELTSTYSASRMACCDLFLLVCTYICLLVIVGVDSCFVSWCKAVNSTCL